MDRQLEIHHRDELRQARAAVLGDAEAFPEILFAIERTGATLTGRTGSLQVYRRAFLDLALRSPLGADAPGQRSVAQLYDLVQQGRNEALHQGAFARHLADHAIELALVMEDALANGSDRVGDYMVKSPVVAHLWQPLRVVRHQMLSQSFSFLPVSIEDEGWRLLSDLAIAKVVRSAENGEQRTRRLTASVAKAASEYGLVMEKPLIVGPEESVRALLERQTANLPVLVVNSSGDLLGIASLFDLL